MFNKKKIETVEDMMAWANDVNRGLSAAAKCDYQDYWGHSSDNLVKRLFVECPDHRMVLHAVFVNQSYEQVENLLNYLARTKANDIINEEWDKREKDISDRAKAITNREKTFNECIKSYWKKMREVLDDNMRLRAENKRAKEISSELRKENSRLRQEISCVMNKAADLDEIRRLLFKQEL